MYLLLFKALHIIGFVAWFAGLFYLVRIFVYHAEAKEKPQPERDILIQQFNIMEWRVYKLILNPAMMITFTFGIAMLVYNPSYLKMGWIHIKLLLVFLLLGYHIFCKKIIQQLEKGENDYTSTQFRLLNEIPTLFLIGIVLLAVFKNNMNAFYIFGSLVLLGIIFYWVVKIYKRRRMKEESK